MTNPRQPPSSFRRKCVDILTFPLDFKKFFVRRKTREMVSVVSGILYCTDHLGSLKRVSRDVLLKFLI